MTTATTFRALHGEGKLLVLPNAWDAATARLVESCGAQAIATTSAAVAWAHGKPDGEKLDLPTVLAAVREIVGAVRVPVTADMEAGFSREPAGVAETIAKVLDAGAVGVNLEDADRAPEDLAARITVAKRAAAKAGVDLYVNARTDVYLAKLVPAERAVEETLRRAALYREAGADGLFVPYLLQPAEIEEVVRAVKLPVNLLAVRGLAPIPQLKAAGVRRLSTGSALAAAAMGNVRKVTKELLGPGTFGGLFEDPVTYAEMNKLLEGR